jgi:hypothetical protein
MFRLQIKPSSGVSKTEAAATDPLLKIDIANNLCN